MADLNRLRLRAETHPEVPEGEWYKDFGTFKICGQGALAKTFLVRGQVAKGEKLSPSANEGTAFCANYPV